MIAPRAVVAAVIGMNLAASGHLLATPLQTPLTGQSSTPSQHRAVLDRYCVTCHNERRLTAGLALDKMDLAQVGQRADVWEKVVRELRIGAMPPAGVPRPDQSTYNSLSSWLETELDAAAAAHPVPGRPTLHRLNRAEYTNAIRDLLALEIDGRSLLPPDNSGYGFDNIGDVLSVSPVLMDRYLSAAATISRQALGVVTGSPSTDTYTAPGDLTQDDRISDDLPFGSRGGLAIRHYFPVNGEYVIKVQLQRNLNDTVRGLAESHQINVMIDGSKLQSFTVGGRTPRADADRTDSPSNPPRHADAGLELRLPVQAGLRLVGVTFVQRTSSMSEDLVDPSRRNKFFPLETTGNPGIASVAISGPYNAKAGADTASRRRILVCRPVTPTEETACARKIIASLARRAFRQPVIDANLQGLMRLYASGRSDGGFDSGIERALRGILVSAEFLFRFESDPADLAPNTVHRISDVALASRLSFFLWSSVPDEELLNVAEKGKLRDPAVLEHQVRRLLADSRSQALGSNFAEQWLYVRNVPALRPKPELFPSFDENLRRAFKRETELFFDSIVRENRSVLDLLNANYTFVNEDLARHYGLPNIYGNHFRRVTLADDSVRRGLLGQGSILAVTSFGNRTSPVIRGKWILENILGIPPPPPPPNVPDLKERGDDGKMRSMREQLAQHRANPACASCHKLMDPLGFALENFDATGRWRGADESGTAVDASGALPDGSTFDGPAGLRTALTSRRDAFTNTLIEKLLTYALGRGVEYYDAPAVRAIARSLAAANYSSSSLIMGIVKSAPFQNSMSRGEPPPEGIAAAASRR